MSGRRDRSGEGAGLPEGDTIFRAARTLHRALAGRSVTAFESELPALNRVHEDAPLTGRTIEGVNAVGKHLLMHFSGGLVLRTHMRMNGSWHIYRAGERWRRPRRDMRIRIRAGEFDAVGFNIPVAEFTSEPALSRHHDLRALGPDLLADEFPLAEAMQRMRRQATAAIADALINQRVVAGLGNVYKSEILFICRINPFVPVREVSDADLTTVLDTSRRILRANVSEDLAPMTTYGGYRRTTRRASPRERLWVYGRARLPCRRCATPIRAVKQGVDARLTYWCAVCQPGRSAGPQ
jgi:endonuclease VIII